MRRAIGLLAGGALVLSSCGGGGGGSGGGGGTPTPTPTPSPASVFAVPAQVSLTTAEVEKIIAQAAAQAQASSAPAVISVVDRVGNVLAVFGMTGAPATAVISAAPNNVNIDVQGLTVPSAGAAIAKAVTGAYLSSGGNAFSSRTASMIVQQHFPPAPTTAGLESGPLFGVQFSQLPCSDLSARFGAAGAAAFIGPKRSPLGLAADPGGFPLYKNGVLVGGIGVSADGVYGADLNVLDVDNDVDERIALAGTVGFEAAATIIASQISVDGSTLRYSDVDYPALFNVSGATYANTSPALGGMVPVIGYFGGATVAGAAYGSEASGIRKASTGEFSHPDAFMLTDGSGALRFPVRAATDAGDVASPITAAESRRILEEAFAVMAKARAQIRRPLDSRAQVTISLVDTRGAALGVVRSPDAPIFGIDVSLQKARTSNFMSHPLAGSDLLADPSADVRAFVAAARTFLGNPSALTGGTAFSDRAIGNISRPYFPDGQLNTAQGPFSRPIAQFNPFSTGLQSALGLNNIGQHLNFVTGASGTDTPQRCTFIPDAAAGQNRLQNGIQIFPGAVPVYRGNTLVGGLGVSGDGIDQDDMISFLGLNNAGAALGGIGNASAAIRSDNIVIGVAGGSVRLRFVGCPFAPFIGDSSQNVCQGL